MTVAVDIVDAASVDIEHLAPVYAAAFAAPPWSEPDATGLRQRLPRHREHEGFALVMAEEDARLVGFAYGFTGTRGGGFIGEVASVIGPDRAAALLGGHFALAELAVHPSAQGRGIGRRLVGTLLAGRQEPRALLQTADADTPASRLYASLGFERLAAVPLGVAMVKELR